MATQCIKSAYNLQFPNISCRKWRKSATVQHAHNKFESYTTVTAVYHFLSFPQKHQLVVIFFACSCQHKGYTVCIPLYLFVRLSLPLVSPAYLSSVPHVDEGAHRLEGAGAAGQEVSAVVGLKKADKVGTLRLQKQRYTNTD